MEILTCEQRSLEWYQARKGIPTASGFDKILTSTGQPSKQRTKYMYQLAGERLGGIIEEDYQSFAMLQGIEKEEEAISLYELINEPVQKVGFCLADGYGASPDGLVDDNGLIELKCPIISTHIEYLIKNELPIEYFQQTQGQLLVTDRDWVDFMSYYPGLKPLIVRVQRNDVFIISLRNELRAFIQELNELVRKLT